MPPGFELPGGGIPPSAGGGSTYEGAAALSGGDSITGEGLDSQPIHSSENLEAPGSAASPGLADRGGAVARIGRAIIGHSPQSETYSSTVSPPGPGDVLFQLPDVWFDKEPAVPVWQRPNFWRRIWEDLFTNLHSIRKGLRNLAGENPFAERVKGRTWHPPTTEQREEAKYKEQPESLAIGDGTTDMLESDLAALTAATIARNGGTPGAVAMVRGFIDELEKCTKNWTFLLKVIEPRKEKEPKLWARWLVMAEIFFIGLVTDHKSLGIEKK